MPPLALAQLPPRRDDIDSVFGANGDVPFSGWSRAKERLDAKLPADVPAWTLHDFRRTLSTWLHEHDAAEPHIVEELLAHTTHKSGIASVYNQARYRKQKREALARWADHVAGLVAAGG